MSGSAGSSSATKPTLVFLHMRDHVRCLNQHFEVVVVRPGSLTEQLPRDIPSWARKAGEPIHATLPKKNGERL